jgi:magnesium chelatase subunit D
MAALWRDAALAAAAVAVAPRALGGVALRACPGPVRDAWLELWREGLDPSCPVRRIPLHIAEARLLGGLDLAATLRAGTPVAEQGLIADCDGGFAVLAMAERASRSTLAHLATALDRGELSVARQGLEGTVPARLGLIALDEGQGSDEALDPVLRDRLAFHLDLSPLSIRDLDAAGHDAASIAAARERVAGVSADDEAVTAICATAAALGIDSLRACQFALATAKALAALAGRDALDASDLDAAARLVLSPRATRTPVAPQDTPETEAEPEAAQSPSEPDEKSEPAENPPPDTSPPPEVPPEAPDAADAPDTARGKEALEDRVLEAAAAAIPAALLASLEAGLLTRQRGNGASGRSATQRRSRHRGRPMGAVPGDPRTGARLSLIDTLRSAAPWQRLRREEQGDRFQGDTFHGDTGPGVIVRRSDFRVQRFRERAESTIIFAVDASGSAALHRLAEAKGAVELLLNDCYVRRDQVALIAFRGSVAELLLPPTRSLVRAKRNLSALPGGGGTPLASAMDAAAELAEQVQRRGGIPSIVLLTDARANISREGKPGRELAFQEALAAASALRASGVATMVIDTSPRPHPNAEALARALAGRYLPLPHADARALRDSVQQAANL